MTIPTGHAVYLLPRDRTRDPRRVAKVNATLIYLDKINRAARGAHTRANPMARRPAIGMMIDKIGIFHRPYNLTERALSNKFAVESANMSNDIHFRILSSPFLASPRRGPGNDYSPLTSRLAARRRTCMSRQGAPTCTLPL